MPGDITWLLERWRSGDADAGAEVVTRTYNELRQVARHLVRRERHDLTLEPTAVLHEAYLRLLRHGPGNATTREAFFALMAAEMRHRLIDQARRRLSSKRGGGAVHQPASGVAVPAAANIEEPEEMLGRLDAALAELDRTSPRAARVVQLRYLTGLTIEETAAALNLSPGTVKRDWAFARAFLLAAIDR